MKGYRFHRLIALMVMAALVASMAALGAIAEDELTIDLGAGSEINDDTGAAAEGDELDLFGLEQHKEKQEGSIELLGDDGILGQTQIPRVEGEPPADSANGSVLSIKPGKLTVPVNGCATAELKYTGNDEYIDVNVDVEGVIGIRYGAWTNRGLTVYIFGLKPGKATVTCTEPSSGKTAALKVKVKEVEGYNTISVDPESVTVRAGDTATCTVTFSLPEGGVGMKVEGEDVISAGFGNWDGTHFPLYITGLKKGKATITLFNDQNDDKFVLKVKVTKGSRMTYKGKGKQDGKQKCRALLIGNSDFAPVSKRMVGSADLVAGLLKTVKGPKGRAWSVTEKVNVTRASLKNAIHDTFADADEDDLSLWYICTHGDETSTDEYAGLLALAHNEYILAKELAEMLKAVPGKVIVIIDSCGSGAYIYDPGNPSEENAAMNGLRRSAEAFDRAAIDAFADADTCVEDALLRTRAVKGEVASNTGELRVPDKFYVLTASRYLESALGAEWINCCYFTRWLAKGVGKKGRMPADKNRDGVATLRELYRYIARKMDDDGYIVGSEMCYQHVQMYPKNSEFKVFKRK